MSCKNSRDVVPSDEGTAKTYPPQRRQLRSLSDKDLMEALGNGDESALTIFVNRYLPHVYRFALRLTNDEFLAEDVSQEVFLRVYQRAGQYDPRFTLKTWILTIARNASVDMLRSRKWWSKRLFDLHPLPSESESRKDDPPCTGPTPEEQLSRAQDSQKVLEALQSLPETQRTAIVLQYYEGLSVKEIAEVMRSSVSSIESLLARARRNLGKFLAT